MMIFRLAHRRDIDTYTALARSAQGWLQAQGLGQYVPAAHPEYLQSIHARVAQGTLYAVDEGSAPVAFFSLDNGPNPWWPVDGRPAVYLAGMVAARRGQGTGSRIIAWGMQQAAQRGHRRLRLDCHAGNNRLCAYYESQGFVLRGRIEQHPGYMGCMYERVLGSSVFE
ncbi:hypothetical protein IP84_01650 [beta proteobacterium AAP99]|nr:hypothetical protein IP84_01650 [beta proteobacterium AAP99]